MAHYVPDDPDGFVDEVEQKIRDHVLRVMPHDPSGELEGSSLDSLLLTYGNWRSRFVHPTRGRSISQLSCGPPART